MIAVNSMLDLIRELAIIDREKHCDPDCYLHRREAAQFIGHMIRNPELLDQLNRSAHTIRGTHDAQ